MKGDVAKPRPDDQLHGLGHTDSLTDLPNRLGLQEAIDLVLARAQAVSVLVINLDGFKEVNDTLGHASGDAALKVIAPRIRACLRQNDILARLVGDEFGVLLPGVSDARDGAAAADTIIRAVAEPFVIGDQSVHIGCSIGIAQSPDHGDHAEALLSSAGLALYQAKAEGRHCRRVFVPDFRHAALRKRAQDLELRRAVERGEFELFYQPQVRLLDNALVGAEALIRWRHPERGLLSPAAFLPGLESGLLAAVVGGWVMEAACRQAAAWRHSGAPEFRIGVNLFAAQFRAGDLASSVTSVLAKTGLPPKALEVEITENIILRQDQAMLEPLRELRSAGVAIAFDDYGTGYASLSLLKRYPLTRLKVDQSFVKNMCTSSEDAAIVRAVLYLGRSFDLDVIAEGVETPEQRQFLHEEGCLEAQGYLFGLPMAADDFARRFGLGPDGAEAEAEKQVA